MCDAMRFPDTVEEFMERYKVVDTEKVYTNGAELVPIFRMQQWFEHLPSVQPENMCVNLDIQKIATHKSDFSDLDELPSVQEWTPVTERLPEEESWAIWCSNKGIRQVARWKTDAIDHFFPDQGFFELEDAVAWMPLPEPYKERTDENH